MIDLRTLEGIFTFFKFGVSLFKLSTKRMHRETVQLAQRPLFKHCVCMGEVKLYAEEK